jgi:O-6-methylguanine DNA methyltransferase
MGLLYDIRRREPAQRRTPTENSRVGMLCLHSEHTFGIMREDEINRLGGGSVAREWREVLACGRVDWGPGTVEVLADDRGIFSVSFEDAQHGESPVHREFGASAAERGRAAAKIVELALEQIKRYFTGTLQVFELPVHITGTPFQLAIWRALSGIPFGETRTYAQLARAAGSPRAMRAAGQACRGNPLGIIIPCHRVLGTGGSLTGYAGTQVHLKAALLAHERRVARERGLATGTGMVVAEDLAR